VHPAYSVTFPISPDTPILVHFDHFEHIVHSNHFDIHFDTDNMAQSLPHERIMS